MRKRNMKYNTLKAHVTLVNKPKVFNKIKIFGDNNYTNIARFDQHMRNDKKNLSNVTINKMHKLFKMYIKEAVFRGFILKNPYNTFKPPKAKNTDPVF